MEVARMPERNSQSSGNSSQDESDDRDDDGTIIYYKCSETRVPPVVRRVLNRKGWREWNKDTDPEDRWSLHWKSGRFKLSDWDRCAPYQRLNHCPKSSAITKKDNLHRNIKRLVCVRRTGPGLGLQRVLRPGG
jgi:hypothetical protein